MTEPVTPVAPEPGSEAILSPHRRAQFFVTLAVLVCVVLFWWTGKLLHIPVHRSYEDSVFQQPHWLLVYLVIAVLFCACVAIGTILAGHAWFYAGLFSAALGLAALSMRGGPSRYVYLWAQATDRGRFVFFDLFIELLLLIMIVAAAWRFIWKRGIAALPTLTAAELEASDDGKLFTALAIQVVVMAAIMLVLTPTDSKKGVLVSIAVASLAATGAAAQSSEDRRLGGLFWFGPFVVGSLGYLTAFISPPADWMTGTLSGLLAPLARPLPLDYASVGAAAAMLGYWLSGAHPEGVTN